MCAAASVLSAAARVLPGPLCLRSETQREILSALTATLKQRQTANAWAQQGWTLVTVTPILTARVPILRLSATPNAVGIGRGYGCAALDVDLSLCNQLGVCNSQLLAAYMGADPRARTFCALVKRCERGARHSAARPHMCTHTHACT
jgi:hypothetical protein